MKATWIRRLGVLLAVGGLAGTAAAYTPFEIEVVRPRTEVPDVARRPAGAALAPPSTVPADDDTFYLYVNGDQDNPFIGNSDCIPASEDGTAINDKADCFSLTEWVERTVRTLLQYQGFQNRLQRMIDEMLDDPTTPEPDPLMDEAMSLPLIGELNMGLFVQDLWDATGCSGLSGSAANGPPLLVNPSARIGCKYGDADTRAIDLVGYLSNPANYTITVLPQGAQDGDTPLNNTLDHEGSVLVRITLNAPLDADLIFRQPDFPLQVTSGYYMHAAGKVRISGATIELEIFSVGGNLRDLMTSYPTNAPGYSIGVDFERFYIAGGVDMDVDGFDCSAISASDPRIYNNTPACDVDDLDPGHPDASNQTQYTQSTNDRNKLLAEFLKYIEAQIVYEATRAGGAVAQYLTALEVLDLQSMTHEITNNTIYKPSFENPLDPAETFYLDYGLFYRFNGEYGTLASSNKGADLPGGFGLEVTYTGGAECSGAWNPVPGSPSTRVPTVAKPSLYFKQTKAGYDSFFGVGVHIDPLNRVLDQLWEEKALCVSLWDGNTSSVAAAVTSALTTDFFRMFLPTLDRTYDGRKMMIRIVPRYVAPGQPASAYNQAVDQPRITFDPGDPPNLIPGTDFASNPDKYPGPFDLRIEIPHLELQFLIDAVGDGLYTSYTEMFSVEVSLDVYLGVGWYKITAANISDLPPSVQTGVCASSPYPCRVARINAFVDLQLNDIYEWDTTTFFNPDGLQHALASIIAMLLDGTLQGYAEIGINTADTDLLGVVIDPGFPSGGLPAPGTKEFKGTGIVPLDLAPDAARGLIDGVPDTLGIYLTIGDIYGSYAPDGSVSATPDGYADVISPIMITDMLVDMGILKGPKAPRPPKPVVVDDHPAPETLWRLAAIDRYGTTLELSSAEVRALGLDGPQAILEAEAIVGAGDPDQVRFQYRIDGGLFRIGYGEKLPIPFLLDGHHRIEVWAIDADNYLDPIPAVLEFTVDRLPPRIAWRGDTSLAGRGGELVLGVSVRDALTPREQLSVRWRLDDGAWQPLAPDGVVAARVAPGAHRLVVEATDAAGNVATKVLEFTAETEGFGCAIAGGAGAPASLLIMLLPLVFLWGRRRGAVH